MKNLILMYVAFIGTLYVQAYETIDGITWRYSVSGGEASLISTHNNSYVYTPCIDPQTSGAIIIPSILGGCPVTEIGECSFINCDLLTSVIIPDSVIHIGSRAFGGCGRITSISIGCGLVSINNHPYKVFSGCTNITDVTVPGWQCGIPFSSVTNLVISDGTANIGTSAFTNCSSVVSVTIPNSVTNIGDYAFSGCISLGDITIPSSVTEIDYCAFSGCNSLTNAVVLGTGLYHLYKNGENSSSSPFRNCSNLVSVTTMDTCAFMFKGCNKMKEVILLDGVRQIKHSAFYNCNWMTEINIPDSVKSIGSYAFYNCSSLTRVSMSDNVKSIGSSAFSGCSSLTDINGLPQCVCTGKVSKVFPIYQSITNIIVADGVTRIGVECFKDCLSLKKIVIPASVSVIYDNAFQNCSALEEVVFLGDAPDVGNNILLGTPRSLKITVKEGSVGWRGGVSTELPEAWPVGDATARGISYYDNSADVAAMTPVITPADGSIFADRCEVSISCAMEGAKIYYRTDGKTPKFTDAYLYKGAFTISDTSKIVAVAVKEGVENGFATATLTKRVLTLAEAAGASDLAFTTGGAADWVPIGDLTATDGVSARSGTVGDEEESWMELSVQGSGTLTFNWKVSCEDDPVSATWDHLAVFVDGKEREDLCFDGETGWENASIVFDSEGNHTVRWVYVKDESDSEGEDCTWVTSVTWKPVNQIVDVGDGKSVVVPTEWIDRYESIVSAAGGDKAAALQRTAANGRKVWECFMLGVDPTKADDDFKITRFWMEDGKPMFEFSHSADGADNSFVPLIKVKGKAKLLDGWSDVPEGGEKSFRFFTVEVELP